MKGKKNNGRIKRRREEKKEGEVFKKERTKNKNVSDINVSALQEFMSPQTFNLARLIVFLTALRQTV